MSSRNAPPHRGALRDDTENGCVADYPIQDYVYPYDHSQLTYEMTLGFKPFTYNVSLRQTHGAGPKRAGL